VTPVFLAVFLPLLGAYLVTLSPTIPLEDGGEMIRAAFCLGVTHPPGYPLYTLAGRLFQALPVGDPAFRMNFMSAVAAAAACGLLAVSACRLAGVAARPAGVRGSGGEAVAPSRTARVAAVAGGLLLGFSPAVWWQGVIAEKYPVNLMFAGLLLVLLARGMTARNPGTAWLILLGLASGLGLSHHGQTVYFALPVVFAMWYGTRTVPSALKPRLAALVLFALVLGLSVKFVFPPVRAAASPLHNWNSPDIVPRYLAYFSGRDYQYRIFYWGAGDLARRALEYAAGFLPGQFGWAGVAVGAWGFAVLARVSWPVAAATAAAWGTGVFYCLNFSLLTIAIGTYYMPTFMVFAGWMAVGGADLSARLYRARPRLVPVALLLLLAWLPWRARGGAATADRGRHYFAWDFSGSLLRRLEPDAVLVAYGDYDLFPLWYLHDIVGVNPGVVVVNQTHLPEKDELGRVVEKRVKLVFPPGSGDLPRRFVFGEDFRTRDPGRPVYFTVISDSIERDLLLPRGSAYRLLRNPADLAAAPVMAEWGRLRRSRTIRGVFDPRIPKDENTLKMLSYYAYSDYRRGVVLALQGRREDSARLFRESLRWPAFLGDGPAAAHASLGQVHASAGRREEALKEFEAAVGASPSWLPGLRALGALYFEAGRYEEAYRTFHRVLELAPGDADAFRDVRRIEPFLRSVP
jgi:hypothetical protein